MTKKQIVYKPWDWDFFGDGSFIIHLSQDVSWWNRNIITRLIFGSRWRLRSTPPPPTVQPPPTYPIPTGAPPPMTTTERLALYTRIIGEQIGCPALTFNPPQCDAAECYCAAAASKIIEAENNERIIIPIYPEGSDK